MNKFRMGWNIMKKDKKGRWFILPFIFSYVLDKTVYILSLTLLKTDLKKKVYKLYLRYRLKNIK
tara:strand:+ start:377 stop:568 length:192 start_codon:yes stop_codon:yes gene_type:complete